MDTRPASVPHACTPTISASEPHAAPRRLLHTRRITFQGFLRDDGLYDIDGELLDSKAEPVEMAERGIVPHDRFVHEIRVRLTIDGQHTVQAAQAWMGDVPFGECPQALPPVAKLAGARIGPGWRRAIQQAMGGTEGCTHLQELLATLGTAAIQSVYGHQAQQRRLEGRSSASAAGPASGAQPPYYLGQCRTWRFDGPVVARLMPQWSGYQRPAKPAAE